MTENSNRRMESDNILMNETEIQNNNIKMFEERIEIYNNQLEEKDREIKKLEVAAKNLSGNDLEVVRTEIGYLKAERSGIESTIKVEENMKMETEKYFEQLRSENPIIDAQMQVKTYDKRIEIYDKKIEEKDNEIKELEEKAKNLSGNELEAAQTEISYLKAERNGIVSSKTIEENMRGLYEQDVKEYNKNLNQFIVRPEDIRIKIVEQEIKQAEKDIKSLEKGITKKTRQGKYNEIQRKIAGKTEFIEDKNKQLERLKKKRNEKYNKYEKLQEEPVTLLNKEVETEKIPEERKETIIQKMDKMHDVLVKADSLEILYGIDYSKINTECIENLKDNREFIDGLKNIKNPDKKINFLDNFVKKYTKEIEVEVEDIPEKDEIIGQKMEKMYDILIKADSLEILYGIDYSELSTECMENLKDNKEFIDGLKNIKNPDEKINFLDSVTQIKFEEITKENINSKEVLEITSKVKTPEKPIVGKITEMLAKNNEFSNQITSFYRK